MLRNLALVEINKPYFSVRSCFLIILLPFSAQHEHHEHEHEQHHHPITMSEVLHIEDKVRVCVRMAENEVYEPAFEPYPDSCQGWVCWHSQLKVSNKMRILRVMNVFRNDVAKHLKISNMHKLSWHWALEQEALRAAKGCNRRYLETYEDLRNIEGLGSSLRCENGCLTKTMTQNPSQKFFVNVLIDLLRNNSLQDFNLDGTFRRANAMFLGCALTVRNTITENNVYADIYHFVCVFCTKDSEMRTAYSTKENDSDCPPTSFRGAEKLLPELCAVKGRHSFLMCVPYNICHWEKTNRPVYWQTRDPGTVIELTMVETNTGPVLLVKEEHIGSYNKEGKPSYYNMTHYLDRNGSYLKDLMFYPQLPKYVYDHSPKHLQKLSDTLSNLTKGALTAISPVISEPAVVYIPNEAIEGTEDAWCCTYVLILSCFPTCVLAVLICYTIKNF